MAARREIPRLINAFDEKCFRHYDCSLFHKLFSSKKLLR